MRDRVMCHDCPHRREHEVGDEIVVFPAFQNKPHACHNAITLPCVGHVQQQQNLRMNVVQVEDYEKVRTIQHGIHVRG
jgi:hypothetical protein